MAPKPRSYRHVLFQVVQVQTRLGLHLHRLVECLILPLHVPNFFAGCESYCLLSDHKLSFFSHIDAAPILLLYEISTRLSLHLLPLSLLFWSPSSQS